MIELDSRRAPVRVGQHLASIQDQRLPFVIGSHLITATRETPSYAGENFIIKLQVPAGHPREDLPRYVVFGRPKTSRRDDDRGPPQCVAQALFQYRFVIAHDGLELNLDAYG